MPPNHWDVLLSPAAGESCHKVRNIQVVKISIAIHVEHHVGVHIGKHRLVGNWIGQRQDKRGDVEVIENSIAVGVT